MSRLPEEMTLGSVRTLDSAWPVRTAGWWSQRREASLNWLALGVLLAAWNASENAPTVRVTRRPEALRGYHYVSVRAAQQANLPDANAP
jgi:hypothetical protein